jgi:hypothetical protein
LTYPDVPQESDSDKAQKIRFAGASIRSRWSKRGYYLQPD